MDVTIVSLWLPIVLSTVAVFLASALAWTVMPHHKKDWKGVPDEEAARGVLKGVPPGLYSIPYAGDQRPDSPEIKQKMEEGPVAFVTMARPGAFAPGKSMTQSFIYNLIITIFVAYLCSRTMSAGTDYLMVFRVAGTTAWLGYAGASFWDSIWFAKPWKATWKHVVDSLVYALLTAGFFGWLWPG